MKNIITLGPEYSYSHILAQNLTKDSILIEDRIETVIQKVADDIELIGIVPIENLIHGSVRETLKNILSHDLKIIGAYDLAIHHCLASKTGNYIKIISHQQAIGQCSKLLKGFKGEIIETKSTSYAMQLASKDDSLAAIGAEKAAEHYGLKIIKKDAEDNHNNMTRFVLISKKENPLQDYKTPRTSLFLIPHEDRPGLLFEILSIFKIKNINLTKIESMPTGEKMNEYIFYIELESDMTNKHLIEALDFLKTIVDVKNVGSYDLN